MQQQDFAALISRFEIKNLKIAIAVSGGADSMALALLYKEFLHFTGQPHNLMVALTVDHQLREESTEEAKQVSFWMEEEGIKHEILTWQHEILKTQIEEKARQARYELLTKYCQEHNISVLLTAHHAFDQIETFFMRLMRGSGLSGLCCMHPVSCYNGISIIRPLLTIFPHDLKEALDFRFHHSYLTDPSNFSNQFERVRWRNILKLFEKQGINVKAIIHSLENLQDINDQLKKNAYKFIKQNLREDGALVFFYKNDFLKLMPAIGKNVLKILLGEISQDFSPCSQRIIENLYLKLVYPSFKGATAHHCVFRYASGGRIFIFKEIR